MSIFRSIVFTAVIVGLISGLAVSVMHQFTTVPLILAAEVYEQAGETGHVHGAAPETSVSAPDQSSSATPVAAEGHHHDAEAWAPADGWQRTLSTTTADILTCIGYALVLTGLFSFRGQPVDVYQGLIWGLCGFAAVVLAPGLGLPPELPGTPAGPLADRQVWWIATVVLTGVALALIAFKRQPWALGLALVLMVIPHVFGAPVPPDGHALAPESLSHRFVTMATVTAFVLWAMLGSLSAVVYSRFKPA